MPPAISEVAVGPGRGMVFAQGGGPWAIVLPGAGYGAQAPLLWYAREVALASGRNVLVVTDLIDRTRDEPIHWVADRAEAALDRVRPSDAHPLLVAKSLTTLAAPLAAREGLPAIWLTPLIASGPSVAGQELGREIVAALNAATAPRLVVGGSGDPSWDGGVARSLRAADVLELPDADHSLQVPGDPRRSLAYLSQVMDEVERFLARLVQ